MARKGQRIPTRRGVTPETVKKQPEQWDRERVILQRRYLIAQMYTCFVTSFFLLELFVRFGSQSLIDTFCIQQILSTKVGVYLDLSFLFFLFGLFLSIVVIIISVSLVPSLTNSMTLCVNKLLKGALWWNTALSGTIFLLALGVIIFTITKLSDSLDPYGSFYQFMSTCGLIALFSIIVTQSLAFAIPSSVVAFTRLHNAAPRLRGTVLSIYSHLNGIASRLRRTTLSAYSHLNGAIFVLRNKISRIRIVRKKKRSRRKLDSKAQ